MACLGGTIEEPKIWIRVTPGGDVEARGRICDRLSPRTSRAFCFSCPAFRGVDRDGNEQTGVALNGEPIAFSLAEHELWRDDPEKFWARKEGGGWHWHTLEGDELRAEYMRGYRETHPGYEKAGRVAARMRRYRARKALRKAAGHAKNKSGPTLPKKAGPARARATQGLT